MSMTWCAGIASKLPDGRHALLVDVDKPRGGLSALERRVHRAIRYYELPDVHIRRSSPDSYHVVAAAARPAQEIAHIQRALGADRAFIAVGLRRGTWILRTESLPEAPIEDVRLIRTPWAPEISGELQAVEFAREK